MPAAPDFRLHHSNALDVLAGLLAAEVTRLPDDGDWLRQDMVLVPQYSMRRWLQQALAERLGICANLRFLTPGEFVELALDANLGPAPDGDRLAPAVLRWHVLAELQSRPPPALAAYLNDADPDAADPRRAWSLAGALADNYEKYQAWRRDWLLRWERGAEAGDWDAALWRRIARGRQHRARRIDAYLQRFGRESEAPAGLPSRLFVFACQNVSPDVLQVIASQARAGVQHFYLHTPARAYWGDVRRDDRWQGLERWAADYAPADDERILGSERPSPLLAAWGQAGRDFIAALGSGEVLPSRFETAPFAEPPRATLLGRLQADVLDNAAPLDGNADATWPRAQVDRHDASLQFHACHTRLREVQVLHDQLRALLDADPPPGEAPLQPRDIAVLAPDIDAYAPHVEAVFGGALGTARELPYTIADTSPLASAPLAEAFLRLCELPQRPASVADVLDLLAVPAVAARFGLDGHDHGALQAWLEDAGARWGLDAQDRARTREAGSASIDALDTARAADDAYTLAFALDRLLLGYASGADHDIGDVAPWPHLEGQAADALDALLRFLALLRQARAQLAVVQPPAAWQQALEALLDGAFAPARDSTDAAVLRQLRDAIAAFAQGAVTAGFDAPVAPSVVLEHLRAELGQADARAPFLSGGICFGRMVPMRLIPFRVVCLLSLDEAAFPARDVRDPLNRIARALDTRDRRAGDPSRRDADRYLFLQLFTSAGRVLYLSWCGMDPRDNSTREPSAVVSELLDIAAQYHAGDADAVRAALVVRHALQPFAPAAFGVAHEGERVDDGIEPRRFSFDTRWHPAAAEAPGIASLPVFAPPSLRLPPRARAGDAERTVTIDHLRRALQRPHAVYLQDGLGLRLPEDEPPLPEHEPLGTPDALGQWALRHAVFDAWLRAGARPDAAALHARLLARAQVAPGADGRAGVAATLEEIAPFVALALDAGFNGDGTREPFAIDCGARELRGTLERVHPPGLLRVVLNSGGVHGGHRVRHGLDRLCASALRLPLHELARPEKDAPPTFTVLEPLDPARAADILASLLELRDTALRAPLVFLPKAGFRYVQVRGEKGDVAALKAARSTWVGNERQDVRAEATPATAVALRGRDPFVDDDVHAQAQFERTAPALFTALAGDERFDLAVLDAMAEAAA